jgi:polyhydroxybutyrate depolymerase
LTTGAVPLPDDARLETLELEAGGRVRRALVVEPAGAARAELPVVLMFHGAGATAAIAMANTGWAALAAREGFVAVFPEGTPRDPDRPPMFRQNPQSWNDGSGRGHVARAAVDDVAFTAALLDALAARRAIDRSRVYATGFSNGAALAFRLGAELADRLAAIAPVAGLLWLDEPRPSHPVPLFFVVGAADPLNPLEGGEVKTPWGRSEHHPPPIQSVDRWRSALGCGGAPERIRDDGEVRIERWSGCRGGAEVLYCTVEGLGHVWPGGARLLPEWIVGRPTQALQGSEEIWRFFRRHRR